MSPDTAGPGFCDYFCISLSKEEPIFSCIQNQGSVCEKHERMVAGRHGAEPARTWKRRTSFRVMIKQSQRKEEVTSLGQTAKTTSGDGIRDLVGK